MGSIASARGDRRRLVESRAVFARHALVCGHLDERVSEPEAARTGPLDQSLPLQCVDVTLDERACVARKKCCNDLEIEIEACNRSAAQQVAFSRAEAIETHRQQPDERGRNGVYIAVCDGSE